MTSLPATFSDTVNNGSRKSGKHQPSAPSAHYTSEKVAPTSLGMSLFLDAPLSWHRPLPLEFYGETEVSHSVTAIGLSSNAWQDIHRQAAERLALMGRAVSVSQPHGCCQRCGNAAVEPTRPAKFGLGGYAP